MENGTSAVNPEEYKNRGASSKILTVVVFAFMAVFFVFLIYRLYDITVKNNDIYAKAAASQQWTLMTYSAERGIIYDCNGMPLASNTYDYTVVCTPSDVTSTILSREEIIAACIEYLGVTYEKMDGIIPVDPNDPNDERNAVKGCDVAKNIPAETKEAFEAYLKENKVGGFSFTAVPQRYYNYGSLAAQVIGYAKNDGVNLVGLYGLEAYYNDLLSGTNGYRYSETDEITGGVLPYSEATVEPASDGYNIVTNIDINVQRIAEEACYDAYEKYQPIDGVCAIVIDPYTGAILAMVSLPNYDLNDPYGMPYGMDINTWNFMSDDDKIQYIMGNCWRNRCVSDTYEPGSTFKALTTCIAMEENLTNEDELFSDAPVSVKTTTTTTILDGKEQTDFMNQFYVSGSRLMYIVNKTGRLNRTSAALSAALPLQTLQRLPDIAAAWQQLLEEDRHRIQQLTSIMSQQWPKEEALKKLRFDLSMLDRKISNSIHADEQQMKQTA